MRSKDDDDARNEARMIIQETAELIRKFDTELAVTKKNASARRKCQMRANSFTLSPIHSCGTGKKVNCLACNNAVRKKVPPMKKPKKPFVLRPVIKPEIEPYSIHPTMKPVMETKETQTDFVIKADAAVLTIGEDDGVSNGEEPSVAMQTPMFDHHMSTPTLYPPEMWGWGFPHPSYYWGYNQHPSHPPNTDPGPDPSDRISLWLQDQQHPQRFE
eukprot:TRINITY_DN395_c1_g3_i2.p1 TRINITY_DN395_c1_g3~~TRINITY_DN395_c1_g3_i2.p1  ORF type:complete len:215 (+),score=31.78 TRINITY_DN395_c1_g3_i2:64-708(+)